MSCVMCHLSCVMCHVSCVMCHVSCVMCHVSCVMCFMCVPESGIHYSYSRPPESVRGEMDESGEMRSGATL